MGVKTLPPPTTTWLMANWWCVEGQWAAMPVAQCVAATCLPPAQCHFTHCCTAISANVGGCAALQHVIRLSGLLQRPKRILPCFCSSNKAVRTATRGWQIALMMSLSSMADLSCYDRSCHIIRLRLLVLDSDIVSVSANPHFNSWQAILEKCVSY